MAFYDDLLLRIVHTFLWLFSMVYAWLNNLKKLQRIQNLQYNPQKGTLGRCLGEFHTASKLPHHLSLVILDGEICYADIANIIVWCLAMGISNISVFDSQGLFKKKMQVLKNNIKEKQIEVLGADRTKFQLEVFIGLADSASDSIDCDTMTITEHFLKDVCQFKTKLHILGPDDGHAGLVRSAQRYCTEQMMHQRGPDDRDKIESDIRDVIQNSYNFPDPDLIIKFGPISSLLGFLPWQIRLTEIISYPSHVGIDYKSFLALLQTYSKTEQRFGK